MVGDYIRYSPGFRAARLRQLREGVPMQQVADEYGLRLCTLQNWLLLAKRGAARAEQAAAERQKWGKHAE